MKNTHKTTIRVVLALAAALCAVAATAASAGATTYYVDSQRGQDGRSGSSQGAAWRSLERASRARLGNGDRLLLKRGASWSGTLRIGASGITVGAYGRGARPRLSRGRNGGCLRIDGSRNRVSGLEITGCRPAHAGVEVGGSRNTIRNLLVSRNEAGISVRGERNRIVRNTLRDNNLMTRNTCGGNDDYGAYAIALEAARGTEVAHNTASGSYANSCDYGVDGSMVEVFRARDSRIHHNRSSGNQAFAEIGGGGAANNRFDSNRVTGGARSDGFVVHGGGAFGGTRGTLLTNNDVRLSGERTTGLSCSGWCTADILRARNNVFVAASAVVVRGPFEDEDNVFSRN